MRRRRAQDRVGRERLRVVDERLVPDRRDGQHDRVRGELRRRRDERRPRVARGAAPGGDAPPREGRVGDGADGDDDREGDPDERLDPRRRGPRVHEERREVDLGGDAVAGNFPPETPAVRRWPTSTSSRRARSWGSSAASARWGRASASSPRSGRRTCSRRARAPRRGRAGGSGSPGPGPRAGTRRRPRRRARPR